jgi:hypothetical protein
MEIVDLALAFKGWVFGGYVRDVVVLGLDSFTDIDIVFTEDTDIDTFIRSLSAFFKVTKKYDKTRRDGLYMSKCAKRLVKLTVDNIPVDIVVINCGFEQWCDEHSTDLSCNLFYISTTVPLGIRYIPYQFRYEANPAKHIIQLTKQKMFIQLYGPKSDNFDRVHKAKIEQRIIKMENKGWVITGICSGV